jgi:hypothetical protein
MNPSGNRPRTRAPALGREPVPYGGARRLSMEGESATMQRLLRNKGWGVPERREAVD